MLLVREEAHRYMPADGAPAFAPTRRAIDGIAKESRKHGVSLRLVSRRPAELSASSLSQCGTALALRIRNERSLDFVRDTLPDGFGWLAHDRPGLATGEAVVVGHAVRVPMQVRFRDLPAARKPARQTPAFSAAWNRESDDEGLIARAVARWRLQRR